MPVKRSNSKGNSSIKAFFSTKAEAEGQNESRGVDESEDKTSDYDSESSRSATPSEASRSATPSSPPSDEVAAQVEASARSEAKPMLRAIYGSPENESEEDDGSNVFKVKEEADEDSDNVNAAIMTGLLSADVKNEEDRVAAETLRFEKQEQARRKQELEKEAKELNLNQRFEKLQKLLGKSKFYSDFLLKKMTDNQASQDLRNKVKEVRKQKREEREELSNEAEARKSKRLGEKEVVQPKKRGRKRKESNVVTAQESPLKKLKTEDVNVENNEDAGGTTKLVDSSSRKFEGKNIPLNQPLLLTGGIMRTYQIQGFEWMSSLWENGINGILADEMGLGKTIQTVALFCHMYEMGVMGPFLVVAPLSTVPNWVNEFKRFAPKVPCVLYHGSQAEREKLRQNLGDVVKCEELGGKELMKVVVTSYEIAMNDQAAFNKIMWRYIVVDEGHRLKNMNCRLIKELKKYHSANRLLLTGTPLQNNLSELWSLLNFLLPEIFDDLRVFESWFNAKDLHENEEEAKRITAQEQQQSILTILHQILTPFLLRRVKSDVDLEIPPKKEVMVFCPLTSRQEELYRAVVEKTIQDLMRSDIDKAKEVLPEKRKRNPVDYSLLLDEKEYVSDDRMEDHIRKLQEYNDSLKASRGGASAYAKEIERQSENDKNFSVKSRLMDMRKAVNHPYLIEYPVTEDGMFYDSGPEMVDVCGKLQALDQMLAKLMKDGHKTLIFSQMTKMLDILGDYCNMKKWKFCRLDGGMNFIDRQADIDKFNQDPDHMIFLLSTRAGGLGINLTAADTVIIYDSDWNPQQDLQAQDRCHRIGQTKPVMIYRLVTANTIDHKIVERAAAKRKLEKMVIHKSKFKAGAENLSASLQSISPQELLTLLDSKDYCGSVGLTDGQLFSDQQLAQLLDRSDLAWDKDSQHSHQPSITASTSGVQGVFKVIDQDEKKMDLGSVK